MIIRPRLFDYKIIAFYIGKIIIGFALTMFIPAILALCLMEINPLFDFLISIQIALIIGVILTRVCHVDEDLNWMQGMIVVSLSWLAAMLIAAIPLYLSGHWKSFLDACFDSMSGLATTGLVLVNDLDHLSYAHNFWRHFIMFLGGQGIIIIALSFLVKGFSGAFRMYVGEARDERILPNVVHTSRFIWMVSLVFLVLGTCALGITGIMEGMSAFNAFFHGACIFMAAFDTGGFAVQSQNILYYHSFGWELITVFLMILGAINFRLHYFLWNGFRKEILHNIEARTFFISVLGTLAITVFGLMQTTSYPSWYLTFRKGFYQLISGHTGTGFQTIYPGQFVSDWPHLALCGVMCAMALGGAVCSTTGAIKMLRVGMIFKSLALDLKKIILPERAVVLQKFHHMKTMFLDDKAVRLALMITMAYILLYIVGAFAGMMCGYPMAESFFESISAGANVGLSCGITQPAMPNVLKYVYIIQMWAGRLEFMSVFTLIGFLYAVIKGK